MKNKIGLALAAVFLIVVAIVILKDPRSSEVEGKAQIKRGSIVDAVYGIGTLTAEKSLSIKSGVTSGIRKIYAKEGDLVKKGQRLLNLEEAGEFIAPFDGVVSNLSLKEGETVFAQTSILTLTDRSAFYLIVSIEQQAALKVKTGMSVRISFDGMRNKNFSGRVEAVYANSSEFVARISVRDLPENILPGMAADVAIVLLEKQDVLLIPVAAIRSGKVKLKRDSQVKIESITTGLVDGAFAEIISGDLREGDTVLLEGRGGAL